MSSRSSSPGSRASSRKRARRSRSRKRESKRRSRSRERRSSDRRRDRDRGDRDRSSRRDRSKRDEHRRDRDRDGDRRERRRSRSRDGGRRRQRSRSREKRGIDRAIEYDKMRKKEEALRSEVKQGRKDGTIPEEQVPAQPMSNLEKIAQEGKKEKVDKEKPNFEVSGALAAETNSKNGVVLKFTVPPEARKPELMWRLYVFKGESLIDTLHIAKTTTYLVGRDRKVADIPIDHPSASQQHCVLQYRAIDGMDENGEPTKIVKPYILDLVSTHGTFLNGEKIEPQRYIELRERDVIKFGLSTREYVLLHSKSAEGL